MKESEEQRTPTQDEVRSVMNEVYNVWFSKYKNAETDQEFQDMVRDVHEIKKKYPFKICHDMLLEMSNIIENYYKERNRDNG